VLTIGLVLLATAGFAGWLSLHLPPDPTRVTTLQDSGTGSLRWAIDNALPGSTITFDASLQGTLRLTEGLHIGKRLTIRGPGAGHVTVTLNGNPSGEYGVSVSSTSSVTIADLAFNSSSLYNPGTLTLINSTVSGNRTDGSGGGIYNAPTGTLTLISSTVSGNLADAGGGISNDGGTLTLINSTISDNMAQRPGGGILNGGANSQTKLIFCTVYGNTSREDGGGIWNGNPSSQLVMRNSLVGGNKSPTGPDILGLLTSQGYNLIQNTQDTTFAPNREHGTDLLQVAPKSLGIDPLLRDNDGPTQTHALLSGSAAIDRIPPNDCRIKVISTDQRGVRRPQGMACDIGAYELRE
jgi:parallel beta helix pectate lyase-like protein